MAELTVTPERQGRFHRIWDSDLAVSFRSSKLAIGAGLATLLLVGGALLAPLIAPFDPFDLAKLDLMDAHRPPVWLDDSDPRFLLGTDGQGRDLLSAMMYGTRISLMVGLASVLFAGIVGVSLGLIAGYVGGAVDSVIMRIAEVQMTFPAILIALLIDGTVHGLFPGMSREVSAFPVLVLAIGMTEWVKFARVVRSSTLVERHKDYVAAARLIGVHPLSIMVRHVLPNVMGPVLVIATITLGLAILIEATLSFLGVGIPPTQPSLGTLIRVGQDFLFSGEWWVSVFPGVTLAALVLSVNLLGDWLRDALNPKLR